MTDVRWRCAQEHTLTEAKRAEIQGLLSVCFPEALSERIYYKQLPHWRHLGWCGEALVAHAGVEHRVVGIGGRAVPILGVSDLCVSPAHRGQGLARSLLEMIEGEGRRHGVPYVMLFADDPRLYTRCGYRRVDATARWVAIHDHETLGVKEGSLGDCMMAKSLSDATWPMGEIDLLGHVF